VIRPASTTAPRSIQSQRRLLPEEEVGVAVALEGVAEALVGVAEALVGVAVTVTVVAGAVVVTVTVGVEGAVAVGLAGAVVVSVAAGGSERLAKLLITLEALLPMLLEHPAARHATSRIAAAGNRLFVERRMRLPPPLLMADRWAMIPPVGFLRPHPSGATFPASLARSPVPGRPQASCLPRLAASPGCS
jgi:hypothetical protein